jgi:hypothetical protein
MSRFAPKRNQSQTDAVTVGHETRRRPGALWTCIREAHGVRLRSVFRPPILTRAQIREVPNYLHALRRETCVGWVRPRCSVGGVLRVGEQRHSRAIFGSGVLRSFVPSALVRAGSMRRGPAAEQWRPIRDRYLPTTGYPQWTERGRDCGRTIDNPSGRGARRVSDPDGPLVGTCPGRWHTPLVRTGCADVDHVPSASYRSQYRSVTARR